MTNGDYIRKMMTDAYIALKFCSIASQFNGDYVGCDGCPLCGNPICASFEVRLKWLKVEHVGEKETETETETEFKTKHSDFSDLLYAIRYVLCIIKWYEGCDYDKYCTSEGDGNIRDCIEGLQYVENELKKMEEE